MKQDWTEQLRDRMADHKEAVPEGLWADIESALATPTPQRVPLHSEPLQQRRSLRSRWALRRRWATAAAVGALILGGTAYWLRPQSPEPPIASVDTVPAPTLAAAPQAATPTAPPVSAPATTPAPAPAATPASTPAATPAPHPYILFPVSGDSVAATSNNTQAATSSTPQAAPHTGHATATRTKKQPALSVALHASNGLLAYNNTNGVQMSSAAASIYNFSDYQPTHGAPPRDPIYLTGYEERQHHSLPVAVGLSVGYALTPRWTVSSGLVYTRLRSEFTSIIQGRQQLTRQQTLHYVGVPLGVQYQLWNLRRLKVYASAQAEADWNVSAKQTTAGVDVAMQTDRAQWSVGGAVGVQYDVVPQLGFFAEPGVRYYFDNGSPVQNYFKDQPTTWNIQLGLRLNLGGK